MAAELAAARQRDLLHHGLVATVLGYPLSIALSLLLQYLMREAGAGATLNQLTMWVVYPLWLAIIGLAFLARSRRQCWGLLLTAQVLASTTCLLLAGCAGVSA